MIATFISFCIPTLLIIEIFNLNYKTIYTDLIEFNFYYSGFNSAKSYTNMSMLIGKYFIKYTSILQIFAIVSITMIIIKK